MCFKIFLCTQCAWQDLLSNSFSTRALQQKSKKGRISEAETARDFNLKMHPNLIYLHIKGPFEAAISSSLLQFQGWARLLSPPLSANFPSFNPGYSKISRNAILKFFGFETALWSREMRSTMLKLGMRLFEINNMKVVIRRPMRKRETFWIMGAKGVSGAA